MKTRKNISTSGTVIYFMIIVCVMLGCSKEKEKMNPLSQMQKRLKGIWTVNEVTLSGADVTIFYQNLTIDFNSDFTFTCENEVDPVWPSSGTYENILENDLKLIVRNDGIRMTVMEISSSNLVIQFYWPGTSGGKQLSLNGEYEFTFTR